MDGRILSTNVMESEESEIIESDDSKTLALFDFSDCLGIGCFVFIFRASIDGVPIRKEIMKSRTIVNL